MGDDIANEIQFPMSEYAKDETKFSGWKQIAHGKKDKDGAPVTADGMDEGADDGSGEEEGPDDS
jgi:hypothetical protein